MRSPASAFAAVMLLCVPASTMAAPWWYVDHGEDRVLFIDAGSITQDGPDTTYAAKTIESDPGDPVSMTSEFMRADCHKRLLGRLGIQRYGRNDMVIDSATGPEPMGRPVDALGKSALQFVCSNEAARRQQGQFALAIDDRTFSQALIADKGAATPRALHDQMLAAPGTTIVRSSAADPASFGQIRTVAKGSPVVPPRDYAKGPQVPAPADYSANEVGRIYDIAYLGMADGEMRFAIRGYAIDDLAHAGSGQIESFPASTKVVHIRDIVITIQAATPGSLTCSIAIEKDAR